MQRYENVLTNILTFTIHHRVILLLQNFNFYYLQAFTVFNFNQFFVLSHVLLSLEQLKIR